MNINLWQDLSTDWQDFIMSIAYVFPVILVGALLFYRLRPLSMIKTLLKRYTKINALIIVILGVCLSISIAIKATTHSYKTAMAKVANRFELVITAPGSKVDMMLSTVYLKSIATPLLQADIYEKVANDTKIAVTAPIAFGDSYDGFPVVGSTNSFIKYLSENQVSGHYFNSKNEAIIGAGINLNIDDTFTPQHGVHKIFGAQHTKNLRVIKNSTQGQKDNVISKKKKTTYFCPDSNNVQLETVLIKKSTNTQSSNTTFSEIANKLPTNKKINNLIKTADDSPKPVTPNGHHHAIITVVGKMPVTHSPWDKAIITPVESVWSIHGLPSGHPPGDNSLGEPFDMDYFSGTPAILVHPKKRY